MTRGNVTLQGRFLKIRKKRRGRKGLRVGWYRFHEGVATYAWTTGVLRLCSNHGLYTDHRLVHHARLVHQPPTTMHHAPCTMYLPPCTMYLPPCTNHHVPTTVPSLSQLAQPPGTPVVPLTGFSFFDLVYMFFLATLGTNFANSLHLHHAPCTTPACTPCTACAATTSVLRALLGTCARTRGYAHYPYSYLSSLLLPVLPCPTR